MHAPDFDDLVAAGGREDGSVCAVFGVGGGGGRPGAVEDHARVAFGVGFQEGVRWRRSSRIILATCSVRLEKHPLPIAADAQQEAVVGRKSEAGDSEGMRGERRFDLAPLFRLVQADDGVVEAAGFAGGGDEGAGVVGGYAGDFVAVAVEFFVLGPEGVAGEVVFYWGLGEREGG